MQNRWLLGTLNRSTYPQDMSASSGLAKQFDVDLSAITGLDVSFGEIEKQRYIGQLATLNLERIKTEPAQLQAEFNSVQRQIEEYAFANYRPFIEAGKCTEAIQSQLDTMSEQLSTVCTLSPTVSSSAEFFQEQAQAMLKRRSTISNALSNHVQLTEILEIPKLMETLVRTEAFEDALELSNYMTKLRSRYPSTKIVVQMSDEVDACCKLMATMLLRLLRRDVQLPECLRYVSYLRRLQLYDEQTLRWHFLACRDCWFEDIAPNLNADVTGLGAYELLMQLVDNVRMQGFQIITQYRAIFADDTNAVDAGWENGGLLFGWTMEKMSMLVAALTDFLPKIDEGARISTVLSQAMYAGASLGRAGADFRPLLPGIFEPAILSLLQRHLAKAYTSFESALNVYGWIRIPRASSWIADASDRSSDAVAAPALVVEYTPLAIFLNGVLQSLNEIRSCAPTNIVREAAQAIHSLLDAATDLVLQWADGEESKAIFPDFCQVFADEVLPHVAKCFEMLFRGDERQSIWEQRGGTQLDVAKLAMKLRPIYNDSGNHGALIASVPNEMVPDPTSESGTT